MTTFEVHISRNHGQVEEPRVVWVTDPTTQEVVGVRSTQSLALRTQDMGLAIRVRDVWNALARRSDDRLAWIREVPNPEPEVSS